MDRRGALIGLHAAVLLFGVAGLFGKWLLLPPIWIVLGRTAIAATSLGGWRVVCGGSLPAFDARLIANGAVLALHWVAFFAAIQVSSVAIGLLGYASFPLFVLVLERLLLGRRWTYHEAAVAALVACGLALLVPELSFANRATIGLMWSVLSGFTFALLTVMNRFWVAGRPATDVAFWQNVWAAVVLLPIVIAAGTMPTFTWRDIALLLVLGMACTAVAHTLFIACLGTLTAHAASVVAALEPVYGITLASVLLGEIPDTRTLAGAVVIIAAAFYTTWHISCKSAS